MSAPSLVQPMKIAFACHGIPQAVIADNMPFNSHLPFNSHEFRNFAKLWNFELSTSSPRYPKSDSEAEKYVGIVKVMIQT